MTLRINRRTGFALVAGLGLALAAILLLFGKPKAKAATFGYTGAYFTAAFDEELKKIGQISPQEFGTLFARKGRYLDKLTFDPTEAKFYSRFCRSNRFRLNDEELAAFKKNGFVVSERMGDRSFAEMYHQIFASDLPVFISADSLLHAWHRSYDAMFEELEETYLFTSLEEILTGMADQVGAASSAYGGGVLGESVLDADYFLAVARSLLAGRAVRSQLNKDERVASTLQACDALQMQEFRLFGRERGVDFSQFKVRGRYENSELLKRYFKAMMWCGRIDLRIAGGKRENLSSSSPRELGAAVVLNDLLQRSKKFAQWSHFDSLLQTYVGNTDSMTFGQLNALLIKGGIKSPADVTSLEVLEALQIEIIKGNLGVQQIRSDALVSSEGPEKAELPRSFTFLGQKFLIDAWATSKIVFDNVYWSGQKVQRRIPSALDVGFAVFANDHAVPLLVGRMTNSNGKRFRDGLNYQHNLAAVRRTIDAQPNGMWNESIASNWLGVLRELSLPADGKHPEVMQTPAWAMKTLNTQLASWTQLRHDTILYVKEPGSPGATCEYPAGFVEPNVPFWERFEEMAARAAELIEKTPFPDRSIVRVCKATQVDGEKIVTLKLLEVQKRQAAFFRHFARQLGTLKGIAAKQYAQKPLTEAELKVLRDVIHENNDWCARIDFSGWYPALFYKGRKDSEKEDELVADVHTNVPAHGDPGSVLTQGVGNIDLLIVAIDRGKDRLVYAGPTLSHYEFEMPGMTRKSDSEWKNDLAQGKIPPRPEWTKSYLIPRTRR